MAHDLIFIENRRTPKVVSKGDKYEPKPSEGKITKRRAATEDEEKAIARGDWVRVNEKGEKPSDSGYMKKKSKVRPQHNSLTAAGTGYDGVTHAGIAIVAADTGNVLLAQRAMDDTDDEDVQETWEFPGGGLDVPEEPLDGAMREFSEEVMLDLPEGEVVNGWRAGEDGHYQGFVYQIATEFDLSGFEPNEEVQAVAWVDMSDTDLPIRPELADFDVSLLDVSGNEDDTMVAAMIGEALPTGPIAIHGVLAPEDVESGDGRGFNEAALTRRDALRLPFAWQKVSLPGHTGSVVVGSIDRMMRKNGLIHWEGSLLATAEAEEFIDLLVHFGRYGVSIDADKGSMDEERSEASGMTWFDAGRIAGATGCAIPAFSEAYVALGLHPEMPQAEEHEAMVASGLVLGQPRLTFDRGPGWVTNPVETKRIHDYWTKKGEEGYAKIAWGTNGDFTRCTRLVGAKIAENSPEDLRYIKRICAQWHHDALGYWPGELGKPGNAPDTPENRRRAAVNAALEDNEVDSEEIARLVAEDLDREDIVSDDESEWEAVLVSSAAGGVRPPLRYFHRQESTEATVIEDPDENGFRHTYGYAAEWGVCHIGFDGKCVEPPETGSDDYPEFHLGRTRTEEGYINTGLLTYAVGHRDAKRILLENATQQHFDNIKNAWAAVRVGEDDRGIWFSGVVLPKVDEEDITLIQASGQVSGEWKHGAMRTCLTVGVPGFPVMRASAEYDDDGNVVALAASAFGSMQRTNGVEDSECAQPDDTDDPVGDLALAVLDRMEGRARMQALRETETMQRFALLKQNWEG